LYFKKGFQIRNNIFHGNVIFNDTRQIVLRVTSCLVALSFIEAYYYEK